MDDRERIADCIALHIWGCEVHCAEHGETVMRAADAVLAALDGRLTQPVRRVSIESIPKFRSTNDTITWIICKAHGSDWQETMPTAHTIADAVLAALGDRLLPELPEWVERVDLSLHESSFDAEGPITIFHDGSGPTIAAAIRDAIGEVEGADAQ